MVGRARKTREPIKTLIGHVSEHFRVIDGPTYLITARGKKRKMWVCLCVCGKTFARLGAPIRSGQVVSCGCVGRYTRGSTKYPSPTESTWAIHRYRYTVNARNRGVVFDLDIDTVKDICAKDCYYCKAPPRDRVFNFNGGNRTKSVTLVCNGIDRVDSTKGYTLDNVRPCCTDCNRLKSDLTEEEFAHQVSAVYMNFAVPYYAEQVSDDDVGL